MQKAALIKPPGDTHPWGQAPHTSCSGCTACQPPGTLLLLSVLLPLLPVGAGVSGVGAYVCVVSWVRWWRRLGCLWLAGPWWGRRGGRFLSVAFCQPAQDALTSRRVKGISMHACMHACLQVKRSGAACVASKLASPWLMQPKQSMGQDAKAPGFGRSRHTCNLMYGAPGEAVR